MIARAYSASPGRLLKTFCHFQTATRTASGSSWTRIIGPLPFHDVSGTICKAVLVYRGSPARSGVKLRYHICCSTFSTEHRLAVKPYNQNSSHNEKVCVVRLGVWPDRIDELVMEQGREQNASIRGVVKPGHYHADCDSYGKKRCERPSTLLGSTQHKCGQMPEAPDNTENQPRPHGCELSL